MITIRDRLLRKWRHSISECAFNVYKRVRNRVTMELRKSKKLFSKFFYGEQK